MVELGLLEVGSVVFSGLKLEWQRLLGRGG